MLRTTILALALCGAALAYGQDPQGGPPQGGPPQGGPGGWQGGPPPAGPNGPGMQRGGPMGPGMMMGVKMGGPRILMRPDVQKELKLSDEQKQKLGQIMPPPGGPGF